MELKLRPVEKIISSARSRCEFMSEGVADLMAIFSVLSAIILSEASDKQITRIYKCLNEEERALFFE